MQQASQLERQEHLHSLLSLDPGLFCERYIHLLDEDEVKHLLEPIRSTYEVDFYLRLHAESGRNVAFSAPASLPKASSSSPKRMAAWGRLVDATTPQPSSSSSLSVSVKNRRLAHLRRLEATEFLSEASIRARAPLLYHQYLGDQDGRGIISAAPQGQPLSSMLLHQMDELATRSLYAQQFHAAHPMECDSQEEGKPDGPPPSLLHPPATSSATPTHPPSFLLRGGTASRRVARSHEDALFIRTRGRC